MRKRINNLKWPRIDPLGLGQGRETSYNNSIPYDQISREMEP